MNFKLIGKSTIHLDDKNRFIIPKKYLEKYSMPKSAYSLLVSGFDVCPHLDIFLDESEMSEELEKRIKIDEVPYAPQDYILDKYYGNLYQLSVDGNGRTSSIGQYALDETKVHDEIIVIGKGVFFSVFDSEIYNEYLDRQRSMSSRVSKARNAAFEKFNTMVADGVFLALSDGDNNA